MCQPTSTTESNDKRISTTANRAADVATRNLFAPRKELHLQSRVVDTLPGGLRVWAAESAGRSDATLHRSNLLGMFVS